MNAIITTLLNLIGSKITTVICDMLGFAKSFFEYRKESLKTKNEEKKIKESKELSDKIDKVTEKGTIEDLLNLNSKGI